SIYIEVIADYEVHLSGKTLDAILELPDLARWLARRIDRGRTVVLVIVCQPYPFAVTIQVSFGLLKCSDGSRSALGSVVASRERQRYYLAHIDIRNCDSGPC